MYIDQRSYLYDSAKLVVTRGGVPWLLSLRGLPRLEVRRQLLALPGVGPKVADCVALFSLDQSEAVPVDTHVRDICVRDYIINTTATAAATLTAASTTITVAASTITDTHSRIHIASAKSLTPTIYEEVGDIFRERFQKKAGW